MSRDRDDAPGLQDAALLLAAFRRSSLRQLELRVGDFSLGLSREGALRPAAAASAQTGEVLRAPHLATVSGLAGPGEVVPAGEAYAIIEVLGVETPLVRAVDTRVLVAFAAPGDLVEFDTPLLEAA